MDKIVSPSFPNGIGKLRTESEARSNITMLDAIRNGGAAQAAWASKYKACAHCGAEPPLAAKVSGRFIIACENDECPTDDGGQCSGATVEEAWAKWNRRA